MNNGPLQGGYKQNHVLRTWIIYLLPKTDPLLLQVPIDLNSPKDFDPANIKSVLLDKKGLVLKLSPNNIGYKVGYYEGQRLQARGSSKFYNV
jgi:hypothetical protein